MIFKGIKFRRSGTVVTLPKEMWAGDIKNHVTFGRVCPRDTPGAVQTDWILRADAGRPDAVYTPHLYALPIPLSGHSLTYMAYGADGRVYLCLDGHCYTAVLKRHTP